MQRTSMMGTRFLAATCACALALGSTSCASWPPKARNPLAQWLPSKNHGLRRAVVIVLHATEQASVQVSLDTLRSGNAHGPVSAHYLIGRDGKRYQLVTDRRRAWHAGGGRWGTITDLNSASIGIELDNDGRSAYTDAQIESLLVLLEDLCRRLDIPPQQVIAHADLAPARKTDPGALFPWQRLAAAGFGRWPDRAALAAPLPANFDGWLALQSIGYRWSDPQAALRAFRLHFRGIDDALSPMGEDDLRILHALVAASMGPPGEDEAAFR